MGVALDMVTNSRDYQVRYFLVVVGLLFGAGAAVAEAQDTARRPALQLRDSLGSSTHESESTLADQVDVAVTVYNNLALVRDSRKLSLLPGEHELRFSDVAQQIRPETVSLRSTSAPGSLRVIEQNYEYDLISPAKLMEKYVGKKVTLQNFRTDLNMTTVEAELLSVNESPVYKVGSEIYIGHPGHVVLAGIPADLIARPSLIWLIDNKAADQQIEATYLTSGISWSADYVVTLAKDDASFDLEGWVTLNNQSGAQYTNAQLKLVAGEVNVVQPLAEMNLGAGMAWARDTAGMREEPFAEYHLYTLPRRTTIKQNQSKQVSLLRADGVQAKKAYEYRGSESFYSQRVMPMKDEKVAVFLVFQNAAANRLGVPLPGGVMRVYQEDSDGMLQFAGEDRINHTPKDEEVRLRLGQAFDVVAERTQTDYRVIADNEYESAYEIRVRNHKDSDITVDIVEPMTADWEIRENSHEFVKKDARTAVFSVKVAQDGETVVTYRVEVSYGPPTPLPRPVPGRPAVPR
jgi:hypothetical protein